MQYDSIEEIAYRSKQQGRRLLVVEFGEKVTIASTENPKIMADQIGEAIAAAVGVFHSMSEKEGLNLTQEEVFDGVVYACFSRASKILRMAKAKSA